MTLAKPWHVRIIRNDYHMLLVWRIVHCEYRMIDWLGIAALQRGSRCKLRRFLMNKRTKNYLRLARKYGPWIITTLRFMKLAYDLLSETPNYASRKLQNPL